ncbi:MAG TPA: ATPase, T2SS/T4P/T4SS family [Vicinamibacterales bacterium]|nr:ATPase, T2SS/T4P/T4SS family [Vicinamibacterales bacterium]
MSTASALASPPTTAPRRTRLGEILVRGGAITEEQLQHALTEQPHLKLALGKVLIRLSYVTDDQIRQALSTQLNIPYIDLDKIAIDTGLSRIITRSYARRHSVVPIARVGRSLTVAMDDPTAQAVVHELTMLTGSAITVVTASTKAIQRTFARLYGTSADSASAGAGPAVAAPPAPRPAVPIARPTTTTTLPDEAASGRGDELFYAVLREAIAHQTSDIHLEMLPSGLHIRYRVDGVLRRPNLGPLQRHLDKSAREVISRVKILSKLDIAERRRPQDGSFQAVVERNGRGITVDLRVSCVPSYSGESVVIRILDRSRAPRSLDDLDLSPVVTERLQNLLKRTTGIFLVTGPTGSGKSTTLYSCLLRLHRPEIRILTAEDPVEYVYEELSQSEVNDAIGNTFATFLRAFLRHDPEVIMVGEIRDEETAEMAFRAAQTGHFLLSTLHTNSAVAALPRLLDLDIESSLIASSLVGVMSQRLVRKICPDCVEPFTPPADQVREFFTRVPDNVHFVHGRGCETCGGSGYRGRMIVADLWVPDEEDAMLITREAPFDEIRRSTERTTFSMAQDANDRLMAGRTTLEELLRVLPYTAVAEHRLRFSAS